MRHLIALFAAVLVFTAIVLPFAIYDAAVRMGQVAQMGTVAYGAFAAISGGLGLLLARLTYSGLSKRLSRGDPTDGFV